MTAVAQIIIRCVNAFVEEDGSGGNPAAVVFNAEQLSPAIRQQLAAKTGYSETAFVSRGKSEPRLDFYTPTRPIPYCGHATLAVFSLLAEKDFVAEAENMAYETAGGRNRIRTESDGRVFLEMKPASSEMLDAKAQESLLSSLRLKLSQLVEKMPVEIVSSGNRFAVIPLKNLSGLLAVQPDFERLRQASEALDLVGVYLFTLETQRAGRSASARMFAPRFGIQEEPATGTAAGPLGCYLYRAAENKQTSFVIEQGGAMPVPRPSKIEVELGVENDEIKEVWVGGRARLTEARTEVL